MKPISVGQFHKKTLLQIQFALFLAPRTIGLELR